MLTPMLKILIPANLAIDLFFTVEYISHILITSLAFTYCTAMDCQVSYRKMIQYSVSECILIFVIEVIQLIYAFTNCTIIKHFKNTIITKHN